MAHAQQILTDVLNNIAKEKNYENHEVKIKPISSGGANYTSTLFTATIFAPNRPDLHLFAKVAALGELMRSQMPIKLYDIEQFAYVELTKSYENIENKHEVPEEDRLVLAKLYGYNTTLYEETIVLDNLNFKGFKTYDRMKSIDWPYASKAIETLAKFHALSIAYAEENPEMYEKFVKKIEFEFPDTKDANDMFKKLIDKALGVVKEENKDRLEKYLNNIMNLEVYPKYYLPSKKPMLVHGDYRPSNLMHRINEDGTVQVIPVDLQTMRVGCGLSDFMYFVYTGSDGAFREQYFEKLVEHYYKQLCYHLRALHLNPDKVYAREDFDYEFKEFIPFGMVSAVFGLPVVTVEAENAPVMDENADISVFVAHTTSDLYKQRINEVVDEYIKWGEM